MSSGRFGWNVFGRRVASALAVSCLIILLAPVARAADPARELYVIDTKRPAVAVVDPVEWKIVASIPIDAEPTAALLGRGGRFLYVLHNGLFRPNGEARAGQGTLSIVDLQARARVATVPLGWNTSDLALSGDGRYLLCVSEGKRDKKKTPDEHGSVVVLDTETNTVTATLPAGRFGLRVATTEDASRIFVLSVGELDKKKKKAEGSVLAVFAPDNAKPLGEIPLQRASQLTLSEDDRWLYVLDAGLPSKKPAEHRNGTVHVVDVAAAAVVQTFDVGTAPRGLFRDDPTGSVMVLAQASFKDQRGRLVRLRGTDAPEVTPVGSGPRFVRRLDDRAGTLVVSHEDMRLLPDGNPATTQPLLLNPVKGAAGPKAAVLLGGGPGELLPLPDQNRIALSVLDARGASSKVAILNLKDNRVEHVLTTGRGGVKFGKFLGAVAVSAAMTGLSYSAGAAGAQASGSPYFFYNVYTFTPAPSNVTLTASHDGRFVYALNTMTNDVTIVRVEDGTIVDRVPVGGGCRRLGLAPGNGFVYAYGPGQVSLIDTRTNQKKGEFPAPSGRVNNVYALESEHRLVGLTSSALMVWDPDTGALAASIQGFSEPFLLLDPRAR